MKNEKSLVAHLTSEGELCSLSIVSEDSPIKMTFDANDGLYYLGQYSYGKLAL